MVLNNARALACSQVDKVGRRPLLLMGAAGCTASLWLLSLGFFAEEPLLSFLGSCALVASYSMSFGPVTWLVTGTSLSVFEKQLAEGEVVVAWCTEWCFNFSLVLPLLFFLTSLDSSPNCQTRFFFRPSEHPATTAETFPAGIRGKALGIGQVRLLL